MRPDTKTAASVDLILERNPGVVINGRYVLMLHSFTIHVR